MVAMNRYTVWTSSNAADYVKADLVVTLIDTVLFYLNGKEVKKYNKKEFFKNNPDWKSVDNAE